MRVALVLILALSALQAEERVALGYAEVHAKCACGCDGTLSANILAPIPRGTDIQFCANGQTAYTTLGRVDGVGGYVDRDQDKIVLYKVFFNHQEAKNWGVKCGLIKFIIKETK